MTGKTVHVTKRGFAELLGVPQDGLPFGEHICQGDSPLGPNQDETEAANYEPHNLWAYDVRNFKAGEAIGLPTCPVCAVLWDEALQGTIKVKAP